MSREIYASLTIRPTEFLRLEDQLGIIEVGKPAAQLVSKGKIVPL